MSRTLRADGRIDGTSQLPKRSGLHSTDSKQRHEAHWPHGDELERVPYQDERDVEEPPGCATINQLREKRSGVEVGDRDQHRWDAPLEAVARAEGIERDVGRRIVTHEGTQVNADGPYQSKHGDSPLRVCGDKDEEDRPAEKLAIPPRLAVGRADGGRHHKSIAVRGALEGMRRGKLAAGYPLDLWCAAPLFQRGSAV